MSRRVSCPRCDATIAAATSGCPRCGYVLVEERRAGSGAVSLPARIRRPSRGSVRTGVAVSGALLAAVVATLALAADPPSEPISRTEAEHQLALRYPRLVHAEHAVIACPPRRIEPGGEARCWVLASVGWQRSVVVRLLPRGNEVEVDD
jgi:Uncharacterised protein family UPF0547